MHFVQVQVPYNDVIRRNRTSSRSDSYTSSDLTEHRPSTAGVPAQTELWTCSISQRTIGIPHGLGLKLHPVESQELETHRTEREREMAQEKINSVKSLKATPFERRTYQEKLEVKALGPDKPNININQLSNDKGRRYTRSFSRTWFSKKSWLTACTEANALFCFPCLVFQTSGSDQAWIKTGITDLQHFSERAKKHEQSGIHMENALQLAMFGKIKISSQLDEGYMVGIRKHNEEVDKNRHILSKIIDCVKFYSAFELALHGHDESESSENPGVFRGLVDFVASLDAVLHQHLQNATVFKGMSKTVQNELLDCMLSILRECILEEIRSADFVSIQVDERMDISTQCQLVLVIRYIDKAHHVQERFFEFIPLQSATADSITTALLDSLSSIFPDDQRSKLISQAYDGASVMRGATGGVPKKIKEVYVNAHYVHCYAHQLNLIMQQVTSHIPRVSHFFSDLAGLSGFFLRSPKRTCVLDRVVAHRLPGASTVKWNFNSQNVSTVFEHKEDLLQCFETIRDSGEFDPTTVREAGGFVRLLEDDCFSFFLKLFHHIMSQVDILYSQLQKRTINSVFVQKVMQQFTDGIQKIRDSLPVFCEEHCGSVSQLAKRCRTLGPGDLERIATEICDTILEHSNQRFAFTNHLVSATLLHADRFLEYHRQFPDAALNTIIEAYPLLNKNKLKTELALIYSNAGFRRCSGAVALYQFFMRNDLQDIFSETVALLKILITTPMTTAESERCFSTLKRIKTFLRNTMSQDHLNALAMVSMEKNLIKTIPDFNHRVIEKFASLNDRLATFMYKK
ncbi:zinc finger MYM-type protein 1-like [Cyprinodon tularosa]|uniref:zinc finger MYM-type protein 1-like n=1 Tax=Cyprinodon tularosa TaxID=77115 RepID=UPI0018E20214|nr:zinc finger MYM-type protein 1-like [Cyprinodon tularosa]